MAGDTMTTVADARSSTSPCRISRARPGRAVPSCPTRNWAGSSLNAGGGHPGNDAAHAAIRRWVAAAGRRVYDRAARLEHASDQGDGVRGRVVQPPAGCGGRMDRPARQGGDHGRRSFAVAAGETVDLVDRLPWTGPASTVFAGTRPSGWSRRATGDPTAVEFGRRFPRAARRALDRLGAAGASAADDERVRVYRLKPVLTERSDLCPDMHCGLEHLALTRRELLRRCGMGLGAIGPGTTCWTAPADAAVGRGNPLAADAAAFSGQGQACDPSVHERRAVARRHVRPQAGVGEVRRQEAAARTT